MHGIINDYIVANDVSPGTGIMGGTENEIALVTQGGIDRWPRMGKDAVARRLAQKIADALDGSDDDVRLAAE